MKLFNKLTEKEKWELQQDFLDSLMNNAWSKADSQSYEIEMYKKKTCELMDSLLTKRKVTHSLSSPQVSRRN